MKNIGHENIGVSPLKREGITHTHPKPLSEILNSRITRRFHNYTIQR